MSDFWRRTATYFGLTPDEEFVCCDAAAELEAHVGDWPVDMVAAYEEINQEWLEQKKIIRELQQENRQLDEVVDELKDELRQVGVPQKQ